ncbi:transporter [Haloimpatiens sp. FM7330]|uniref:YkvI family membrane protein n=1 Tax=Haloimpatiens sp. FM7330 TaxID=3298610 RepID=UPI00363A0C9B
MRKKMTLTFQVSAVFIGTIVGAGLASGQEITQFFTTYGLKSFIGILLCLCMYIYMSHIISSISIKYNLTSYNELINLVSPGCIGKITDVVTGFFLISSSAIILAGSGALLHQYFHISKWIGMLLMIIISLITLLNDTKGLIAINSFIVPSLITIITLVFVLYIAFNGDILSISHLKSIGNYKKHWLLSSLLYGGFNILCCTGVLVPFSNEIRDKKALSFGTSLGALGLTVLCCMINLMLLFNIPYIFHYDIPLLYIAHRFGSLVQFILLCIIFLEMFSTEVSDIYSIGKTFTHLFNVSYKKSVIIILCITIPIAQIGFKNLITFLYPAFGALSLVFMFQCINFYKKHFKH